MSSTSHVHMTRVPGGDGEDVLAVEEPLEIRLSQSTGEKPLSVTMRTPGDDFDLAAGFLLTEGIVTELAQLAKIQYGCTRDGQASGNIVTVTLAEGTEATLTHLDRNFPATSSCGICGKASIDAIRA